jgi:exosortase
LNSTTLLTKRNLSLFFPLVTAGLVLWWHPMAAAYRLGISNDAYTYTLLVVLLSAALVFSEFRDISVAKVLNRWLGAVLLGIALVVRLCLVLKVLHLASGIDLSVSMAALAIWWIGAVAFSFGSGLFRPLRFALCLLLLITPLPEETSAWLSGILQQQSASASTMLFHLIGVPVLRDGIVLSIPGLTIEVAHECSSIRSSTMLILVSLILAHLFLRSGWRQAVLVLAAFPLSVLKNAIRIVTIAELGTRVNPSFLHGNLHRQGGVVFLGLAVVMLVVVLGALRKTEPAGAEQSRERHEEPRGLLKKTTNLTT